MSWLTGWNRRKQITVTGSTSSALSDYQMKLIVNQASGTDSAGVVNLGNNVLPSFNDLRFTKSDGSTLLNYWIESITGTTPNQIATVCTKLAPSPDTIPTSPGTYNFYVYYSNSGASVASNGTNTFIAYTDASDIANWLKPPDGLSGNATSVNGEISWTGSNVEMITRPINLSGNWIIEGKFREVYGSQPSINVIIGNGTTSILATNRNIQLYRSKGTSIWASSPGGAIYSSYTQNTYYIFKEVRRNTSLYDHYIYDANRNLLGSLIGTSGGNADPTTSIQITPGANNNVWFYSQWIFVRKYASPEPTWLTTGTEEQGIIVTDMTHSISSPCTEGTCIVSLTITWQNNGVSTSTITPNISIDGTPLTPAPYPSQSIGPYPDIVTKTFIVEGLTVIGSPHMICAYTTT